MFHIPSSGVFQFFPMSRKNKNIGFWNTFIAAVIFKGKIHTFANKSAWLSFNKVPPCSLISPWFQTAICICSHQAETYPFLHEHWPGTSTDCHMRSSETSWSLNFPPGDYGPMSETRWASKNCQAELSPFAELKGQLFQSTKCCVIFPPTGEKWNTFHKKVIILYSYYVRSKRYIYRNGYKDVRENAYF